jgi:hypothetical protein
MNNNSLLELIFSIQDRTLKKNLENEALIKRTIFIDKCLALVNTISFKDKKHHKEIHFLLNDVFTTIICSTRLGLYGCVADAAAISRIALEHLAIVDYVIDENKYAILSEGFIRGFQKVKIDYNSIRKFSDPNLNKQHDKLSTFFLHSTKNRILYSGIHQLGRDCVGASLNRQKIEELLGHLCNLSLFLTRVMSEYLKGNRIDNKDYFQKQSMLEKEYGTLKQIE